RRCAAYHASSRASQQTTSAEGCAVHPARLGSTRPGRVGTAGRPPGGVGADAGRLANDRDRRPTYACADGGSRHRQNPAGRWAGRQGIVIASARCYAAEGGLVYAPVTTWLRTEAIRATIPVFADVWLTDVARLLPELLAERPDLQHPGPLTEAWQRQRLFESLARATLGDRRPRLLLLDDLQWCDAETLACLHYPIGTAHV